MLPGDGQRIAAVAVRKTTRHASDGRDADAGEAMNFAIGQALLQPLDHRPAVGDGLQLGRGAQVAEERAALVDRS